MSIRKTLHFSDVATSIRPTASSIDCAGFYTNIEITPILYV